MSHITIAMPYLSDAATLSGPDETYGPLVNLQRMQPTDVWAASGGTPYIVIDLRGVVAFNLIALLRTNGVSTDQWRVRTADLEADLTTGSRTYDSGYLTWSWVGSQGDMYLWNSAGWTNRWIRIDLIVTANPFTVGRLYVADAFQPTANYAYGAERGYQDFSHIDMTDAGNMIPNHGANKKVFNFSLNLINAADNHSVSEINRLRGASRDVLIISDPDASTYQSDNIYYGLFQARRASVITNYNFHQASYQLIAL